MTENSMPQPSHGQQQNRQVFHTNTPGGENIPTDHNHRQQSTSHTHSDGSDASQPPPARHLSDPSPRRVVLGSDPGELLASLPALMGFTPENSIVLVGLRESKGDDSQDSCRLTVGPALRADASLVHVKDLVAGFGCFVDQQPGLGVMVLYMGTCNPARRRGHSGAHSGGRGPFREQTSGEQERVLTFEDELVLATVLSSLADLRVTIHAAIVAEAAETGAVWIEYDGDMSGTVSDVAHDPVGMLMRSKGTKSFSTREEAQAWLAPGESSNTYPVMETFHRRVGCSAIVDFAVAFNQVREGLDGDIHDTQNLGQLGDEQLVVLGALCLEEHEHVLAAVLGIGSGAALLREELARLVRTTDGAIRRRLLLILGIVLGLNDEGALSSIVLRQCMAELDRSVGNFPIVAEELEDLIDPVDDIDSEYHEDSETGRSQAAQEMELLDAMDDTTNFIAETVMNKFLSGEHRAVARALTESAADFINASKQRAPAELAERYAQALDIPDWEYVRALCGIVPQARAC